MAKPLQHSPGPRFTIRRVSIGGKTNYPWCLYDRERPSYIGRFATFEAALLAATPFDAVPRRHVLPFDPELVEADRRFLAEHPSTLGEVRS